MKEISKIMKPVAVVLAVMAIAIFGINFLGLQGSVAPPSFMLAFKIGLVAFFSYNLGGFAEKIFDIEKQLLELVTAAGYKPWQLIDSFVGDLIGFASGSNQKAVKDGIIGLMSGSFLDNVKGGLVAIAGAMALWTLFGFLFETVFVYLKQFVYIGFLIIISPIIIPFAVFGYGWKYTENWLKLLSSAMLTPVLMFAVIFLFVGNGTTERGVLGDLVNEVFAAFPDNGKDYMVKYARTSQSLISLTQTGDQAQAKELGDKACKDNSGNQISGCDPSKRTIPTFHSNIDKKTEVSQDPAFYGVTSSITQLHFSDDAKNGKGSQGDHAIKRDIFWALLQLWLFCALMRALLSQMQQVASSLSGLPEDIGQDGGSPLAGLGITKSLK